MIFGIFDLPKLLHQGSITRRHQSSIWSERRAYLCPGENLIQPCVRTSLRDLESEMIRKSVLSRSAPRYSIPKNSKTFLLLLSIYTFACLWMLPVNLILPSASVMQSDMACHIRLFFAPRMNWLTLVLSGLCKTVGLAERLTGMRLRWDGSKPPQRPNGRWPGTDVYISVSGWYILDTQYRVTGCVSLVHSYIKLEDKSC